MSTVNWKEHIIADPAILAGKPVVKGTRLSVEFILGLLAEGWEEKKILENYPQLSAMDLQAIFAFTVVAPTTLGLWNGYHTGLLVGAIARWLVPRLCATPAMTWPRCPKPPLGLPMRRRSRWPANRAGSLLPSIGIMAASCMDAVYPVHPALFTCASRREHLLNRRR